jgi:hypothetical protein
MYHLNQANKNQWKTYEGLKKIQIKKLKKIIYYAYIKKNPNKKTKKNNLSCL